MPGRFDFDEQTLIVAACFVDEASAFFGPAAHGRSKNFSHLGQAASGIAIVGRVSDLLPIFRRSILFADVLKCLSQRRFADNNFIVDE